MSKMFFFLLLILSAIDCAHAAFPSSPKQINHTAPILRDGSLEEKQKVSSSKGNWPVRPVVSEEANRDEGLSAESVISFVLPLLTLAFFIVYTPLTAPVIAIISGIIGITSILLADYVISNEKTGRGLAMAGYVLGTVGALVAAGIGFYYLIASIF